MIRKLGTMDGPYDVITYQIGEMAAGSGGASYMDGGDAPTVLAPITVQGYQVWPNGNNNLAPNECNALIRGNRLIPSLIEKQVTILHGNGPKLYIESISEDGKVSRRYVKNDRIAQWLDSWQELGLPDSFRTYMNKCIRSYYYSEGIYTKWHLSRSQRIGGMKGVLPVAGLEHVSELRCRFATKGSLVGRTDVQPRDLPLVMVGNWASHNITAEYNVYPRMDYTRPLSRTSVVTYSRNPDHGDDIYASNVFFEGVKEWIRGCNATPEFINSFLENALSARHHVIIPDAWMAAKEAQISELCEENARRGADNKEMLTLKIGREELEIGDRYTPAILDKCVSLELKKMTEWLSGRSKNQGKIYATRSYINGNGDTETWKIEPIDQKYKEYIDALITYDKRADAVLLSAKGIDSSISNISAEGTISKSGADVFYNFIIYLTQQALPESIICSDINYALKLNFPEEYAQGIRIGFYRPNVQRQEDTTASQRLSNQPEF